MKNLIIIIITLSMFSTATFLYAGSTSTFRWGNELVRIGDTKKDVLTKCGEPTKTIIQTGVPYVKGKRINSLDATSTPEYEEVIGDQSGARPAYEIWHYNCGKYNFSVDITFSNNSTNINKIETLGRGSGESDCIGAKRRLERDSEKE